MSVSGDGVEGAASLPAGGTTGQALIKSSASDFAVEWGAPTTVAADAVTNTRLADMAQATIKGRQSGAGTGDPEDLTATQALTALGVVTAMQSVVQAATLAAARAAMGAFPGVDVNKDYGAVGDGSTNDTVAIQAALDGAAAGSLILFRAATYKINGALVWPSTKVLYLVGAGRGSTIIQQDHASANTFEVHHASLTEHGGIIGMTVRGGSASTTVNNSGVAFSLRNCNDGFLLRDVEARQVGTAFKFDGCWYPRLENFRALYFGATGILIPNATTAAGGGLFAAHGKISNNGVAGSPSGDKGILIRQSGGDFFHHIDITACETGVVIQPDTASKTALYCKFDAVLADSCRDDGWLIDGTTAAVYGTSCVNCWGAFNTGDGLTTKGASLDGFQWTGGQLRENGLAGWDHDGGTNCTVDNTHIARNSQTTTLTSPGVDIAANVSDWAVRNCNIGNFASGLTDEQAECIKIAAGTSASFHITGNNFDPGTGKSAVSNGSSASDWIVQSNTPIATLGVNVTRGQTYSGSTISAVAAGATTYLGANAQQAVQDDTYWMSPKHGVISFIRVESASAPGVGETYTYTLMVNGSATTMTGQIAGNASFSVNITANAAAIVPNDRITLRLVTSGSATASRHRFYIHQDY